MISAPMRGVHGDRHVVLRWAARSTEASAPGRRVRAGQRPGQPFTHPLLGARRGADGGVHLGPGLLRHAEAAVRQTALHVLAGPAECRQLEVVDRGGAVERQVGDDAAAPARR